MTFSDRDLLGVVDDIYQASVEPEAWQRAIDGIQALLPPAGVDLQGYYGSDHLIVRQGYDPDFIDEYVRAYAADNPWAARVPEMPAGVPVIMAESPYFPEVRRTEFQRYMVDNGCGYGVGLPILTGPDRIFFLVIQYSEKWIKLDPTAAELASALSRHLARSLEISARLGSARAVPAGLAALLERAAAPILVVDWAMRLRHATRRGEALLAAGGPLRTEALGRLTLPVPDAQEALVAAVKRCARGELTKGAPELIPVATPSGPIRIAVVPLAADDSLAKGRIGRFFASERLAMLLILTPSGAASDPVARSRARFGLTAAEAELAAALCQGQSLKDYADRRGVTRTTARNQLQSIFSKTETHRQAELVALLSKVGQDLTASD